MKPQDRSRAYLTAKGYLVSTVERRKDFPDKKKRPCGTCGHQPRISISVDLFNIFDLVALKPASFPHNEVVFVQTTSRNNHSTRRNKILASMEAKLVLLSGARLLIQSWRQIGERGSKWQAYDEWITLDMYTQAPHFPNSVAELMEIRRKAKRPDLPTGVTLPLAVLSDDEMPF